MSEPDKKSRLDRLFAKIEKEGLESLTPSERAAFALRWLYIETNNGGLHQFFYNDAGKLAPDALHGLEMLGATKTARILSRAMSVFPRGVVPASQEHRRAFMCDSLTPEQEEMLDQLTDQFYASPEPVSDLLTAYIAQHPEDFPT